MDEIEKNEGLTRAILNALNTPLMELNKALRTIDADEGIRAQAIILTGSEKAFAGERRWRARRGVRGY